MCGGGGSPPPPPDYSAEKAAFAAETAAKYATQAQEYNAGVDAFNESLSGYNNTLNQYKNQVSGIGVNDIWDDPNTDVNEDPLAGIKTTLNDFDVGSLSQTFDKPLFQSTVTSPWGPVTITDMPTLSTANTTLADNLISGANSLSGQINDLYSQRRTAENELNSQITPLYNDFSDLSIGINRAGIADDLTGYEQQLGRLQNSADAMSNNVIFNQLYPDANISDKLSGLSGSIDNLYSSRAAEQDRIAAYEQGILDNVDNYYNTLGTLGIADIDQINALQDQIDASQRDAGRFSSELGFDLSQENAELTGVENQLADLLRKRTAEQNRIDSYSDALMKDARNLRNTAATTDIYSLGGIDALSNQIADLQSDMGGFTSELDFDFGDVNPYLTGVTDRVEQLRNSRNSALDDILSNITAETRNLDTIPLYNERGFDAVDDNLDFLTNQLGMFTGGRVTEIGQQLMEARFQVGKKREQLQAYRAKLEEDMQKYLQNMREMDYYSLDDVTGQRNTVYSKQDEVNLYKATQAMDEIDRMMEALDEQQARLEADAANVAARSGTGNYVVGNNATAVSTGFAPTLLSNYVSSDEEDYTSSAPSAFSNAVIRIG